MPSEASTGRALPAPDGAPAAAGAATAVTRVAALKFLDAYWAGDLERALAACVPSAVVELPSSVPMLSPALMSEVLPVIFGSVYPRFVDSRFDIQIERCISQDGVAVVEYVAAGELSNGRHFQCRYIAVIEVEEGGVRLFRPYTDTKYVAAELLG